MYLARKIHKNELSSYNDLIPEAYIDQIKAGKFYAGLITDLVGGVENPQVIYITYVAADWLEFVWMHFYHDDELPVASANLMRYIIRIERSRLGIRLKGIFMDMHYDEVKDPVAFRQMLTMAEFECRDVLGNTYEFTFEQVKEAAFLKKAAGLMKCQSLSEANDEIFSELVNMFREDDRPVPVGVFPKWDEYLLQDSLICMKAGKICGALLVSMQYGSLVLDCAFVTDKMALSAMLGTAFSRLEEKYGSSQRILVPVVLKKTGAIVERMVPDAKRVKMMEAVQWL